MTKMPLGAYYTFQGTRSCWDQSFPSPIILCKMYQTHSKNVVYIDNENAHSLPHADGMWTDQPNIFLTVATADCLALCLYHPNKKIIGVLHAGWRGLAQNIIAAFLQCFSPEVRSGFVVHVSPSLGPCCARFSDPYQETPPFFHRHVSMQNGQYFVDLWAIAHDQLCDMGIDSYHIDFENICTKCSHDWWSHRRGEVGRNMTAIVLSKNPPKTIEQNYRSFLQ